MTDYEQQREVCDKAGSGKLTTVDQICAAAVEVGYEELPSVHYREIAIAQALLSRITYLAYKHEVQHWKDAPGTDAEKLDQILAAAREGLHVLRSQ